METATELLLAGNVLSLSDRISISSLSEKIEYLKTCHSLGKTSLMGIVIPTLDIIRELPLDVLHSYTPYICTKLIVGTNDTELLSNFINNNPIVWENCLVACRELENAKVLKYLLNNYDFIPRDNSLLCSCTFSVSAIKILASDVRACPSLRPVETKKSWFGWY